ncbi:MAG TPA: cyclic nucleotide-binding domain-containing protein, partial [Terriglobales bacterium]|nr:cyclic nucleotide-binding domain-containing protein [Terriglobales bacterium]
MLWAVAFPTLWRRAHAIAPALGYAPYLFSGEGRALMARSTVTKAASSLAGIAILARLSPEALSNVERRCAFRLYEPRESIVDYLDQTDEVFFIISGEVRVTIYSLAGKVVSFRELGPGEV